MQGRTRNIRIIYAYVILFAVLLLIPRMISSSYLMTVIDLGGIYMILAAGLNVILGFTGLMSFTQAAFWGIGAYTAGLLSVEHGFSFWLTLPIAGIFTAFIGFLLGLPSLRKLKKFYLAVTTIGFVNIVKLILENWTSLTHGADGLPGIPKPVIGSFRIGTTHDFYYIIMVICVLLVWFTAILKNSRVGRAMLAIREDDLAAEVIGVNTFRYKIIAFTISAFYGGIAGALYAHLVGYISPDLFIFDEAVTVLCMVMIGGSGFVAGPVIGSIVLTILPEWLRFLKEYTDVIYGAAAVVMAVYMPTGLVGLARPYTAKLARWFNGEPGVSREAVKG